MAIVDVSGTISHKKHLTAWQQYNEDNNGKADHNMTAGTEMPKFIICVSPRDSQSGFQNHENCSALEIWMFNGCGPLR